MNQITNLNAAREEALSNSLFVFAQEIQLGLIDNTTAYTRMSEFMKNPQFTRDLLVATLERNDDKINTDVRFWLIDAHDFIVIQQNKSREVHALLEWEVS